MKTSSLSAVKLSADQRRKTRKLDNAGEANRDVAKMTGGGVRRIPKAQVTAQFKCILRIWCCGNLVASRFWVGISVRAHGFRHLFLSNTTPNLRLQTSLVPSNSGKLGRKINSHISGWGCPIPAHRVAFESWCSFRETSEDTPFPNQDVARPEFPAAYLKS